MNKNYFVGIDIGGTRIKAVIRTPNTILKQKIILTKSDLSGDKIVTRINKLIYDLLDFVEFDKNKNSQLCSIGVGVPGIFEKNSTIINLPNLQSLNGINFKNILQSEFGKSVKVKIVNDAQLPYYYFNNLVENNIKNKNVLFLTLGTGFGISFCLNGKMITNKFGACEYSHSNLFGNKKISDYISTKFLLKNLNGSIKQNLMNVDFESYGKKLGVSISVLHNIFGFDKVYLCGGVSNYSKYFLDDCIKSFEKNSYFPVCEIESVKSGLEIGAIGASRLF